MGVRKDSRCNSSLDTEARYFSRSRSSALRAYWVLASVMLTGAAPGSSKANWMPISSPLRWVQTRWHRYWSVGAASGDEASTSRLSVIKDDQRIRLGRCSDMAVVAAKKWQASQARRHSMLVGSGWASGRRGASRQLKGGMSRREGPRGLPRPMSSAMTAAMWTSW